MDTFSIDLPLILIFAMRALIGIGSAVKFLGFTDVRIFSGLFVVLLTAVESSG
jgi:hypothetical protein